MSRHFSGVVGPDGRSALPAGMGIVDHAAGAEDIQITPEVQAKLEVLFKEAKLDDVKARYKLEVVTNDARSMMKPFPGIITAWTNGGFNHGGGDEAVYFCSSIVMKKGMRKTCSAPLDLKWVGKHAAICPVCRNAIKPSELAGQIGAHLTTQGWAQVITKVWVSLGGDADIRLGVMRGNLRRRTEDIIDRVSMSAGDKLEALREKREWVVYPLKNIVKDTAAGADLQGRIRAFLSS